MLLSNGWRGRCFPPSTVSQERAKRACRRSSTSCSPNRPRRVRNFYRDGLARLIGGASLDPLREPWTYQPPADPFKRFLREAKADILQATFNSREWIEARSGGRGGAGTYYLAVD